MIRSFDKTVTHDGTNVDVFSSSDLAARNYRVIVFDRPGFGYSERPRNVAWTPAAQADLINSALHRLSVSHAIVLGHSWGASVSIALALRYPKLVQGLVLASGYYYPIPRADVMALSAPAVPIVGDVLRHTLSPILGRVMWPLVMAKSSGRDPCRRSSRAFRRRRLFVLPRFAPQPRNRRL